MPTIIERDGKYCLDGYGDADACYDSEDEAMAAMKKLMPADKSYTVDPDSAGVVTHKWVLPAGGTFTSGTFAQEEVRQAMPALSEAAEKSLFERIWDGIQQRIGTKEESQLGGFKVFKDAAGADRWLAWYSNNFEDREKEFFSEKGFDRYVARLDRGLVPMPRLRTWHVAGSEYGNADWVDRIGHFHLATGTYEDTELGRAGKAYDELHWKEYGVSHGLLYRLSDTEWVNGKRVYKDWTTFEISTLPHQRAANDLTAFAVESTALKEAEMDSEKRKHLVEKYGVNGEEVVAKLEAIAEHKGKELEHLRAYKEFVNPDTVETGSAAKEALVNADKAFRDLVPDLMEGSAEAVSAALEAVKGVKATNGKVAELEKQIDALRAEMQLAPRSVTQGGGAVLDSESAAGKALLETVQAGLVEIDPLFKVAVRKPV